MDTAHFIMDVIAGKLGSDILLLDISDITLIADYFVIATAESSRQLKAIVEDVQEQVKKEYGKQPLSVEGTPESGWMLLDYGSIVVHVFSEAQRSRYQLEKLWSDARTIVRIA